MDIKDLSQEDQALLNTDLGDYEKIAEEQVKVASAMTELGSAYAEEVANNLEKEAAEKKDMEEKMEDMDEESEKKASDLSAFIERGFVEGLCKIGSELTGDSMTFIRPYIVNSLIADGASEGAVKLAMEMEDKEEKKEEEKEEDSKKEASALSEEDQTLLNTDLGEYEKEAAEQIKTAQEMYELGSNYAHVVAEQMIKAASEEEEEEKEEKEDSKKEASAFDEESEKTSQDLSAFIERGFSEKLASLGEERYGDPLTYFMPYVQEKTAGKLDAVKGAVQSGFKTLKGKASDLGSKAKNLDVKKSVGDFASGVKKDVQTAATGMKDTGIGSGMKVNNAERAKAGLRAAGKTVLPAAAVVGGTKSLFGKKKED